MALPGFTEAGHVIPTITVGGVERKATPEEQKAFDLAYSQTAQGKAEVAVKAVAQAEAAKPVERVEYKPGSTMYELGFRYEDEYTGAAARTGVGPQPRATSIATTGVALTQGRPELEAPLIKGIVIGTSPSTGEVLVKDEFGNLSWQHGTPEQIAEAGFYLSREERYDKPYVSPEAGAPTAILSFTTSLKDLVDEYNKKVAEFKNNTTYQNSLQRYDTDLTNFNSKWGSIISGDKWIGTLSQYDQYKKEFGTLQMQSNVVQSQYDKYKAEFDDLKNQLRAVQGTQQAQRESGSTTIATLSKLKGIQVADPNNPTQAEIENLVKGGLTSQILMDAGVDYSKVKDAVDTVNAQRQSIVLTSTESQKQQTALTQLDKYKTEDGKYLVQDFMHDNPSKLGIQALEDARFPQEVINESQKYLDGIDTSLKEISGVFLRGQPLSGQATSLTNAVSKAGYYNPQ